MITYTFSLDGEPVPKGRVRCTIRGGKIVTYTPKDTVQHEHDLGYAFKDAYPGHEPLARDLTVLVMFTTDKVLGDIDNYLKTVLDAMNGVAWVDDRQVKHCSLHVVPVLPGGGPYTNVQIREVGP